MGVPIFQVVDIIQKLPTHLSDRYTKNIEKNKILIEFIKTIQCVPE